MRAFHDQRPLGAFIADKHGTVTIFGAALIAALVGIVSLVAEYGLTLNRQNEDQRIADAAAFAAASYYGAHTTDSDVLAKSTAIAKSVGSLNGVSATGVTLNQVTSPRDSTKQALQVTITTTPTLFLSEVLNKSRTTLTTSANSYAEPGSPGTPAIPAVPGTVTGCIIALSSTNGVTLSGGTAISAPTCGVATNATVTVPCGTHITASGIGYNTSAPSQGCSGITTTPTANNIVKAPVTDPLATNAGVVAAEAHVATVASQTGPTAPAVSISTTGFTTGTAVSFTLSSYPTTTQTSGACTATYASSTWTVSCPAGTYNITKLSLGGGLNLSFNPSGSASSVYNFNTTISTAATTVFGPGTYHFVNAVTTNSNTTFGAGTYTFASTLTTNGTTAFGAGTYNVVGAVSTTGTTTFGAGSFNFAAAVTTAGTTTFGAGTFNFGSGLTTSGGSTTTFNGGGTYNFGNGTAACAKKGGTYSVCMASSTLTFNGAGTFSIAKGIYIDGGSNVNLGVGSSNNSYKFGAASDGNAIYMAGGAKFAMGDVTGGSGVFQVTGNINNESGGGSCMTFPAASNHDVNGWFSTAGGTILGSGTYTFNGYLAYGNSNGGAVTCNGASVGMKGTNVTFIYSAITTPSSGNCLATGVTYGLCFGAGFSNVNISAPTTGTYAYLLFVGPQSNTSAGAYFTGGAGANMSGTFYMPAGPLKMDGGASINAVTNGCLQIIALSVSMAGGTTAASTCISGSSSQTGTAAVAAVPATPTKFAK